jgi:hypothetical protein
MVTENKENTNYILLFKYIYIYIYILNHDVKLG